MGTVSNSSIAAMCVTLFISLILPVVALIVYAVKNKKRGVASAWFLGAAGFFVTQIVIRVPILSTLSLMPGFVSFVENHYVLYALMLGLTAALFEVVGRFACAKILIKNLTYTKGFAAGLGHGGIEAMVLIGMTYVSNLLYVAMINTGAIEGVIAQTEAMGVEVAAEVYPGVGICPYVMTGGTDAKYDKEVSDNCLRCAPLYINAQQYASIHGLNENIYSKYLEY